MQPQSEQQLNQQFAIDQHLAFETNASGIVEAIIDNEFGKIIVSTYGGQILSYQVENKPELFYLSPKAIYGKGKAIRGGSPVCWPWFGDDKSGFGRPPHGFARNQQWLVHSAEHKLTGETVLRLQLTDTPGSLAVWPYYFDLRMEITLGQSLQLKLITHNTGDQLFEYTQALHSYFKVNDISDVVIIGLDERYYLDKLAGYERKQQQGDIVVDQEVDRIYSDTSVPVLLQTDEAELMITSKGSQTTVVWNPWQETIHQLADTPPADYRKFVCIETANAANDVVALAAGESHSLVANYRWQ